MTGKWQNLIDKFNKIKFFFTEVYIFLFALLTCFSFLLILFNIFFNYFFCLFLLTFKFYFYNNIWPPFFTLENLLWTFVHLALIHMLALMLMTQMCQIMESNLDSDPVIKQVWNSVIPTLFPEAPHQYTFWKCPLFDTHLFWSWSHYWWNKPLCLIRHFWAGTCLGTIGLIHCQGGTVLQIRP